MLNYYQLKLYDIKATTQRMQPHDISIKSKFHMTLNGYLVDNTANVIEIH